MSSSDWIEGYKLGFKEGVEALKTQFKEYANVGYSLGVTFYSIEEVALDEICKELEGENGKS